MAAKRCLVVGISDYNEPSQQLKAMVPEALRWADLLNLYGFVNILPPLLNAAATLDAVRAALTDLLDQSKSGDQIVFAYGGHGTVVPTSNVVGDEALVLFHPAQANPNTHALTDTALTALIKDHPASGAIFTIVLEACFAGGFVPTPTQRAATTAFRALGLHDAPLLSMPPEDVFRVESLETVHPFGGLWDRLEGDSVRPLVVGACKQGKKAEQLSDDHMLFSSRAIPELMKNVGERHALFIKNVNALELGQPDPQIATLGGDRSRDSHPFFT